MSTPSRRRTILIDKGFQLKLVGGYVVILLLGLILSGGLFYGFVISQGNAPVASWRDVVPPLIYTNLFTSLILTVLALYVTSQFSQRIAGPVYRFTKMLKQLGEGELNIDTKMRKNDEFGEFARAMATTTESLKSYVSVIKLAAAEIEARVGADPSPELRQALDKLKAGIEVFRI